MGIGFSGQGYVGGWFIQPLIPLQSIEFPIAEVIGVRKEKAAGGGGVKEFPEPA